MKHKKTFWKALACVIALNLLLPASLAPIMAYTAGVSDIPGHWAEKYINSAISKGIVKGYSDGAFKPDKPVTRAEFASMMNKALGNTGTTSISFTDVPSSSWYYSDISKAVAAAYVSGYDGISFRPDSPITREEAAVMISRIVPGCGTSGNLRDFGDYGSISNWALTGMQKSNGKGYMGAYNDGNLHPKDNLTRAQTAKIIYDITDKETIVTDTPSVKPNGTTLSGKIYSNGVIIHEDLAENSATIDNCVVMGDLSIMGGGSNSVVIYNSRIADCSVAKTGSSVRVVAKGETSILNTDVSNTARLETSNLTGGDSGIGFSSINVNGSSTLTLDGSFPKINLAGSDSSVKLESGTITTLDVSSSTRNSNITADSNSTILNANVNSVAAFHGTGAISTLNANTNNITYEKKPFNINIGSGVTVKPEETSAIFSTTYDPFNEEKNVAINKKITITLSKAITNYNGTDISSSDLKALIGFTKDSKSGTAVAFSATISSSRKEITVIPDNNLATGVKYYVTINSNVFKDANGNGNAAQSVCFTTDLGNVTRVTFNPASGATGVSTSIDPTITFDNAIEKYFGSDITESYLKSSIDFRLNSSNGSKVSFNAAINSNSKVITITPDSSLTSGQKYYLGFDSKAFQTASDDKAITGQNVTWTVGSAITPTISINPANEASGINGATNLFITFSEKMFNSAGSVPSNLNATSAVTIRDNTAGSNISYIPLISDNSSSTVFILNPISDLTAGHNYTVSISSNSFKNSGGNYTAAARASFTVVTNVDVTAPNTAITGAVASAITPTISFNPANEASGINGATNLFITFSEKMFNSAGSVPSNLNVTSAVTIRDNTAGSNISFIPLISDNSSSTVFILNPISDLTAGHNYTVSVSSNSFKNSGGNYAAAARASFTVVTNVDVTAPNTAVTGAVASAITPTISFNPANEASEIKVSRNLIITFSEKMFNCAGSVPNNLNVTSAVTIRDDTAGSNISFFPFISDNRSSTEFILNPIYGLTAGHSYTVSVSSNSFKNSGGHYVAAARASFTVVTNVDVSALNTAINCANNAKTDIMTSKNGSDVHTSVYWVTAAQMAALDNAISKATDALSTVQTRAAANAAAIALDNATTTLIRAKNPGTKSTVDTSEIDTAIRFAKSLKKGVVVSENGADVDTSKQWVTLERMKALDDAIAKAEDKKATVKTSDEVTAVVLELNWAAVKSFDLIKSYGTKGIVDKAELAAAINKANNLKESTEISDSGTNIPVDQYWATMTELSALASDISAAEKVLKKDSATQTEVVNAIKAISDATDYFDQHVRKKGS